jgi:hypothetical protein
MTMVHLPSSRNTKQEGGGDENLHLWCRHVLAFSLLISMRRSLERVEKAPHDVNADSHSEAEKNYDILPRPSGSCDA